MKYFGKQKYTVAESICKVNGGKLPLPENVNENRDMESAFRKILPSEPWITLGLNDAKIEGKYLKESGQPVNYFNWAKGRPSGHLTGYHSWDYVSMNMKEGNLGFRSGTWSDYYTTYVGATICQLSCVAGK